MNWKDRQERSRTPGPSEECLVDNTAGGELAKRLNVQKSMRQTGRH